MGNSVSGIVGRFQHQRFFWPVFLIASISFISIVGLFSIQRQFELVASRDLPAINFAVNLERSARELDLAVTDFLARPNEKSQRKEVILAQERLMSISSDWPFGMQDQRLKKISDHVTAILAISGNSQSTVASSVKKEKQNDALRNFRGDLRGFHGFSAALLSGSNKAIRNARRTVGIFTWAACATIMLLVFGATVRVLISSRGGNSAAANFVPDQNHQVSLGGGPTVLANQDASSPQDLGTVAIDQTAGEIFQKEAEFNDFAAAFSGLRSLLRASDIRAMVRERNSVQAAPAVSPENVRKNLEPLMNCLENMRVPLQEIRSSAHQTSHTLQQLDSGLRNLKKDQDGRERWTKRARLLAKNASLGHANWDNLPTGYLKEFAHEANALFAPWEASTTRLEEYGTYLELRLARCMELSATGCAGADEIQSIARSLPKLIAEALAVSEAARKTADEPKSERVLEHWLEEISDALSTMQQSLPGVEASNSHDFLEHTDHLEPRYHPAT